MIKKVSAAVGPYQYRYRTSPLQSTWNTGSWTLQSLDATNVTFNHYPLDTEGDDGGSWYLLKTETQHLLGQTPGNWHWYRGPFTVGNPAFSYSSANLPSETSDAAMTSMGATAISRCAPTNPTVSLATTIGEMRTLGGVPRLPGVATWKERTHIARGAGSEYLNYEFGWAPLVRDLRQFAKTVKQSHSLWEQYKAGSNKKTRVGYRFDATRAAKAATGGFSPYPSHVHATLSGAITEYTTDEVWFKGAFKYFLPDPNGNLSDKFSYYSKKASFLYGIELTPDTVWNLSPWTWAADWFANTGDLMNNISRLGSDSLVMQYGYCMAQQTRTTYKHAGTPDTGSASVQETRKRQKRLKGNPYGFGVSWEALSPRQLAILTSLGLSKT